MGSHPKKSKTRQNKKRKKRKKKNAPTKAADMVMEHIEQETQDLLDPFKNAKDSDLFTVDKDKSARPKKIKNKTTWADRMTTSRGLGVQLPKPTGKSLKEKRMLAGEREMEIVNAKAARIIEEAQRQTLKDEEEDEEDEEDEQEEGEGVDEEEEDEEEGDVMEVEAPTEIQERKPKKLKIEQGGDGKKVSVKVEKEVVVKKNNKVMEQKSYVKVYDLWAPPAEHEVKPNESFIQEALYHKPQPFVQRHLPKNTGIPAVQVAEPGQSYRPAPEVHETLKRKRMTEDKRLNQQAQESGELLTNLQQPGGYYLPLDKENKYEEEDGGEEKEIFRQLPKQHKNAKEKAKERMKKGRLEQERRATVFERNQRDIHRIDDILLSIEEVEKAKAEKKARRLERAGGAKLVKPRSTDNKKVPQPQITPVAAAPSARLRTLNTIVNPVKDRILSMKSRGLLVQKKSGPPSLRKYKYVEKQDEDVKADEAKYLKPLLDSLRDEKRRRRIKE